MAALRQHLLWQAEDRAAAGARWVDLGLVFTTRLGTPISPRNDYRSFQTIIAAAGPRRVRLHDLRHTAACHVAPEIAREAADRIEGALWDE